MDIFRRTHVQHSRIYVDTIQNTLSHVFSSDFPLLFSSATLVIRICLFPFIIGQRRNLAKYTDAMPKLTLLQERMTKARLSGDYFESEFWDDCFRLCEKGYEVIHKL